MWSDCLEMTTATFPIKLLHVSDLHFGPPHNSRVSEALLEIAPTLGVDAVIASGDFTQRAKEREFIEARQFLNQLPPVPQLVIPGNHDVPLYRVFERMTDPHKFYRKHISEELDTVLKLDGAVLVGLDSTAPHSAITNGRMRRGQLDYCQMAFDTTVPDDYRIVVAHHPFATAPDKVKDRVIRGAKTTAIALDGMDIDLILGGHLHRSYFSHSTGAGLTADKDGGFWIIQSGTTTSNRGRSYERKKQSFNLIELNRDTLRITQYLFSDSNGFAPHSDHDLPRNSSTLPDATQGSAQFAG